MNNYLENNCMVLKSYENNLAVVALDKKVVKSVQKHVVKNDHGRKTSYTIKEINA